MDQTTTTMMMTTTKPRDPRQRLSHHHFHRDTRQRRSHHHFHRDPQQRLSHHPHPLNIVPPTGGGSPDLHTPTPTEERIPTESSNPEAEPPLQPSLPKPKPRRHRRHPHSKISTPVGEQPSQHHLPPQENTEPAEAEDVVELPPPHGQPPRPTRNSRSVGEPPFVIPDSVEIERPHRHHRSKAQTSPPPQETPPAIPEEHPEPRQNGRPSFKLRSPRKGTPSGRQPVTTEAPGLTAVPPQSHQQHHEKIPPTPANGDP